MATLPYLFASPNWFTTGFIAQRLGVSRRTVQNWCKNGFLLRRGCVIVTTPDKAQGGWKTWVHVTHVSKDAFLNRIRIPVL